MEKVERIPPSTAWLMIATAIFFDCLGLIGFIPVVGTILSEFVTVGAYLTFMLWFLILKIGLFNPRVAIRFFGSLGIELVPLLNLLPSITLGVFLTISMIKLEDKGMPAAVSKLKKNLASKTTMSSINKTVSVSVITVLLSASLQLFFVTPVFAQITTSLSPLGSGLIIEANPQTPGPNEMFSVSLTSYFVDLNRSTVIWILDGKTYKTGIGLKQIELKTKGLGSKTTITVLVKPETGPAREDTLVVRPTDLLLIWSAQTSVPPFYKGKALIVDNSELVLSALPQFVTESGSPISPKDLLYHWRLGPKSLVNQSGYGKDSITLATKDLQIYNTLDVSVSTLNNTLVAFRRIQIPTFQSKIVAYEQHPLYGLGLNKGVEGVTVLNSNEVVLSIIPYFFSLSDVASGAINYNWSVNSKQVATGQTQTLRQEGQKGESFVSVTAINKNKVFQTGRTSLTATWEKAQSTLSNEF